MGFLAAAGAGLAARSYGIFSHLDGESPKKVTITRGRLPEGEAPPPVPSAQTEQTEAEAPSGCRVPELKEGVSEKDITFKAGLKWSAAGGSIERARYRLVAAWSMAPQFRPGRWSIALDLSDEQQGAYYRKMGLSAQSSRIAWKAQDGTLEFETVCPDHGEKRTFKYAQVNGTLQLQSEDGTIVVLEPYAESQLTGLPPAVPREVE